MAGQKFSSQRLFLDVIPDTVIVQPRVATDSLNLQKTFLIPRSEIIILNKFKLLPNINYQLDYKYGLLRLVKPLQKGDSLTVVFRKYPLPLMTQYSHRSVYVPVFSDSADSNLQRMRGVVRSNLIDELDSFSGNLQRSGSIVRGIEIGSNRDLSLNSGLNLQISGDITPQVQLTAALTDESTPLQPEGNTQTLQEVDKVFVKVESPYIGGTLGDFNLTYQNSEFGNLKRKLQGITAYSDIKNFHQQVTYATSRGTFHTNQFLGQEGNQGPYQLTGINGETEIIVLAGTEQIFINGRKQVRGENNDYIIDYSLGQITFTNKRLITSEDRIEIDFEYANNFQRYGKNILGISGTYRPQGSGLGYDVRLFREWDDTNNLLEDSAPLTEAEQNALKLAGDDTKKASVNGATFVEFGNGRYVKRDTVVAGETLQYYFYKGSGAGDYNVRFSGVGRGNGDYSREKLGVYRYVGPGNGNYLPLKLIPLAGEKKLADIGLSYKLGKNFITRGEFSLSSQDKNVFSSLDDNDNNGMAFNISTHYNNRKLKLFGKKMGNINWRLSWKQREKEFSPLDRLNSPEYAYKWNLSTETASQQENRLETDLKYTPHRRIQIGVSGGMIKTGDDSESSRLQATLDMPDSTFLKSRAKSEFIRSKNIYLENEWLRASGFIGRKMGLWLPYLQVKFEDKRTKTDQTVQTGFEFNEMEGGFKLFKFYGMKFSAKSKFRDNYLYNPFITDEVEKLSLSQTHAFNMEILENKNIQGKVSLVYRDIQFEERFSTLSADSIAMYQPDPQFQDTSWQNRKSHLGNIELQYQNKARTIDARWNYQIASELEALKEKVFLSVGENRGNYRYDEILDEYVPDAFGDFLLVIVPTNKFESVTNIEASMQFRYRPKISKKKQKGFKNFANKFSTFSFVKVEERSREQDFWQLYLLNFDKYHDPVNTIRGRYTINQDIFFNERNPDFGVTLRSRYRDNLSNQYVDAGFNESQKQWDRSLTWRQKVIKKKLVQEISYKQLINQRDVPAISSRNRDIFGQSVVLSYNYRPAYQWQFRLSGEGALQEDKAETNLLKVQYWELRPQINYSVRGKARATADLTYLDVRVRENPLDKPVPYEMAKGKREGKSWRWNLRFEYFLSTNITMTFNYNGRKDAGALRTIHLGKAEVRAFF